MSGRWGSNPRTTTPLCRDWFPRPVASSTRSLPVGRDSQTRPDAPKAPILPTAPHPEKLLYERTKKRLQKNPTLSNGVFHYLLCEQFRHIFPIQTSVDVVAVGVLC
jgi:hypothetical protein